MRYVTYGGDIEVLTEIDLIEAIARMPGGYQSAGRRTIPIARGFIEVELLAMPERDLGGLQAQSPVLWRAVHADGLPDAIDLTKLHGSIPDTKSLSLSVRQAVVQQLKSGAGEFWSKRRIAAIADLLAVAGWSGNRASIELLEDRNAHYLTWSRSPELPTLKARIDNAINEAKIGYQRQLADRIPRSQAAKASLPDFGLANFETTSVQRGSDDLRLFAFNKALGAQVTFVSNGEMNVFVNDLRTKRALPLPAILQILELVKRPEV
jgi:hypothetical protein